MSDKKEVKQIEISKELFDEIKRVLRAITQGRHVEIEHAEDLLKKFNERE